jgi:hypothetical protein
MDLVRDSSGQDDIIVPDKRDSSSTSPDTETSEVCLSQVRETLELELLNS